MQTQKLTIEKLNASYIKLIKLVLNGNISSSTPSITSFYHDPTPQQAYTILNRIFAEQNNKKQPGNNESGNSSGSGMKKFQLKRANTTGDQDRNFGRRNQDDIYDINNQIRNSNPSDKSKKQYMELSKQKQQDINPSPSLSSQQKSQKLKKITSKITQIFTNNHKKVTKYEQISKYPSHVETNYLNSSANINSVKGLEVGFRKY